MLYHWATFIALTLKKSPVLILLHWNMLLCQQFNHWISNPTRLLSVNDWIVWRRRTRFSESHSWLKSLLSQDSGLYHKTFYGIPSRRRKCSEMAKSKTAGWWGFLSIKGIVIVAGRKCHKMLSWKEKKKKATLFSIKSVNYIRKLEYFWKKGTREVQSLIASGVIQGYSTDSGVLLRQG